MFTVWVGGSLLRCNYYLEYLACEEEDFSERYILVEEDWELLSGERLVILLKLERQKCHLRDETSFKIWVILFPKINRFIYW